MKRVELCFAMLGVMFLINGLAFAQDTTLTVTSAGNVGIGTTVPNTPLHINGTGVENDGSTAVSFRSRSHLLNRCDGLQKK